MTILAYPKFISGLQLPLMQPAIENVLREIECPRPELIAEYACHTDQVETQGMIALFEKVLPPDGIALIKKQFPEIASSFEGTPCKKELLYSGAIPINNSAQRKLVALTCVYFEHKSRVYLNGLGFKTLNAHPNEEYYDFLGRIPGITLIEKCDPRIDFRVCHTYVFGHFEWYKKINPNAKLLIEPRKVLDFLQSQGFTKAKEPAKDQVVVYHTATKTHHFGKVHEVERDGKVMVISKFGLYHIYIHSVGLAQCSYGNSVTFLNPPAK